jgi:hypothetical protein
MPDRLDKKPEDEGDAHGQRHDEEDGWPAAPFLSSNGSRRSAAH